MITLVLSSNMKRMLKNNVLVRKLVGIETAGNINVLLTDKTGTLTKGKLEVINILNGNLESLTKNDLTNKRNFRYLDSLIYNNDSMYDKDMNVISGNSTDRAILKYLNMNKDKKYQVINHKHFDSNYKYSSVTLKDKEIITYYKGASEVLLSHCTKYLKNGEEVRLTDFDRINREINKATCKGIRVIKRRSN